MVYPGSVYEIIKYINNNKLIDKEIKKAIKQTSCNYRDIKDYLYLNIKEIAELDIRDDIWSYLSPRGDILTSIKYQLSRDLFSALKGGIEYAKCKYNIIYITCRYNRTIAIDNYNLLHTSFSHNIKNKKKLIKLVQSLVYNTLTAIICALRAHFECNMECKEKLKECRREKVYILDDIYDISIYLTLCELDNKNTLYIDDKDMTNCLFYESILLGRHFIAQIKSILLNIIQ